MGAPRRPIGYERVCKRGKADEYVLVKVAEPVRYGGTATGDHAGWRMKHVVAWERANGRELPEGTVVMFADRDRSNFDPSNLVAVERDLVGAIAELTSSGSADYHDAESLTAVVAMARIARERVRLNLRDRTCKVCGARFTLDADEVRRSGGGVGHPRQTCPECLAQGRKARGERCPGIVSACVKCGRAFRPNVRRQKVCYDCQPPSQRARRRPRPEEIGGDEGWGGGCHGQA